MAYVIAAPYVGVTNAARGEVCPAACIRPALGIGQVVIDPDACIDRGVRAAACPAEAIVVAEEVPEEWQRFAALNARLARASVPTRRPTGACDNGCGTGGAARRRPGSSKGVSP